MSRTAGTTSRRSTVFFALATVLGLLSVPAQSQAADPCSASSAALVLRSAGGTCAGALAPAQQFNLTYRLINLSIVDDPGGPNDGTLVAAKVHANGELLATLAQQSAAPGSPPLPGTLTFVPVCPAGSSGGTLAAGDPCDPLSNQCGSGTCGCVSGYPGITCQATADPNVVRLSVGADVNFTPGQQLTMARIKVKLTNTVAPPAQCGVFFSRIDSDAGLLVTNDAACETQVSAGAQASADLDAPECLTDSDCGDPQCNACVDIGTNNHCAPRAAGTSCGIDANPLDCLLPACVIDASNVGVCTQAAANAGQGTVCELPGQFVPAISDCLTPQCNASGQCVNVPDPTQNGQPCGFDADLNDCTTPACVNGTCEQGQIDLPAGGACTTNNGVPVAAVECQTPQCDATGICANVADPAQNNLSCGIDGDLSDCTTPACVNGACDQGVIDLPAGGACTSNDGVPVASVECQTPLCNADGICANAADPKQNNQSCGTDGDLSDCTTPACVNGGCEQGVIDLPAGGACASNDGVPVAAVECQTPQCDALGLCANVADPAQNNVSCGIDGDLNDCTTPACVNGACDQGVIDLPPGGACTSNDGVPVAAVECQTPQCNADGLCANVPDPKQNNQSCGTDGDLNDCTTPACVNGACDQGVIDLPAGGACTSNDGVPVAAVECQTPQCDAAGICANVADSAQNGNACGTDADTSDCKTPACLEGACAQLQNNVSQGTACAPDDNICTDDLCDANGVCTHTDNTAPCNDLLFCTSGDLCTGGQCASALIDCSDKVSCTEDLCDEDLKGCVHIPHDNLCDDGDVCTVDSCSVTDGCLHEPTADCLDICRTPGYWGTHSGYEKRGAINVGQLVIDTAGPLQVCGQTITSTSNLQRPYLAGLGLSSDLEGLCVAVEGSITRRQLYRQLVGTALNCAISGTDCDAMVGRYVDVSFTACDEVCTGTAPLDAPTLRQCVVQLDCFNNGGHMVDGACALGTCKFQPQLSCGSEYGSCPVYNRKPQPCVPFAEGCHTAPLCNEATGLCPGDTPATSNSACNEATNNSCTIDSCN